MSNCLEQFPTPRAGAIDSTRGGTHTSHTLASKVKELENFPTPDCSDRRSKKSKQQGLSNIVKALEEDEGYTFERCPDEDGRVHMLGEDGTGVCVAEEDVGKQNKLSCRVLNPRWVELLMGLPVGWVMPSCGELNIIEDYERNDSRTDELKMLGNGVVPATVEKAFRTLVGKIKR